MLTAKHFLTPKPLGFLVYQALDNTEMHPNVSAAMPRSPEATRPINIAPEAILPIYIALLWIPATDALALV